MALRITNFLSFNYSNVISNNTLNAENKCHFVLNLGIKVIDLEWSKL